MKFNKSEEVLKALQEAKALLCNAHNQLAEIDLSPRAGCINQKCFFNDLEKTAGDISKAIDDIESLKGYFL